MSELLLPPEAGYFRVFEHPSGGWVDVHERHGKQELPQNLAIAQYLAARGERVHLLPVGRVAGIKSPDALRDGFPWEFKVPTGGTANAIDKALRDGSKQAPRILIRVPVGFDVAVLEQALYNRIQRVATVREVAILMGDKLAHFSRQELTDNTFRGKLT